MVLCYSGPKRLTERERLQGRSKQAFCMAEKNLPETELEVWSDAWKKEEGGRGEYITHVKGR